MDDPIAHRPRRPRHLFALLGLGFALAACGGFSCDESQGPRPSAWPSAERPGASGPEPARAEADEPESPAEVGHELVAAGEDPHDHTHETGDHALERDPIRGHAPTAVSEDKDRTVLDRLGLRRLPLEDREPEEH